MRGVGRRSSVAAAALPIVGLVLLLSCGGEQVGAGGAAPPPGPGYGPSASSDPDVRVLSRDDCLSLRDHQIDIAVAHALGGAGNDPGERLQLEAKIRGELKPRMDDWVKSCSGRRVLGKTLRCWKDATTPEALVACDPPEAPDAAKG